MNFRMFPILVLLLGLIAPAYAQLPAARLTAVFPPGAAPGVTLDVSLTGQDLDGATELRFSHPGITAKKSDNSSDSATFAVTVSKDVPVGAYDCRVASKYGLSNPRVFVVSDRTATMDAKPGTAAESAGKLSLDQAVYAKATAGKYDFWSFNAAKGQRVLIQCAAREIDSKLSPDLVVSDSAGRELARSRRTGLADLIVPADGVYTIAVSDTLYRGGAEFIYRLTLSTAPHLDAIFPPVGKTGTKGRFTLLGRNLPGGAKSGLIAVDGAELESLLVEIDLPQEVPASQRLQSAGLVTSAGAGLSGFAYRLKSDNGISNPVAILFSNDPVTPESEASQPASRRNDRAQDAQRITLPATVAGRFSPRADKDWYAFEAKKGDSYAIEVLSARLNLPSAVSVLIQKVTKADAGDEKVSDVLESPDDEPTGMAGPYRMTSRDPVMKWEVKEDGFYRICVRDRFAGVTDDPTRGYVLMIRQASPDFTVLVTPLSGAGTDSATWSPTLRKGGAAAVRVMVLRRDGHAGDVTVEATGLPSGVSCRPITLGGTDSSGVLVFNASDDAGSWAGSIQVIASGKVGDADVKRDANYATVIWGTVGDGKNNDAKNIDVVNSRFCREMALGVIGDEAEPLTISAESDQIVEAEVGSKLSIPLKVKKTTELKQPLKLKVIGIDGMKGAKEITLDVKADKATFDLDLAQNKLSPGTYTFCLSSAAQVKYIRAGEAEGETTKGKEKKGKKDPKDVTYTVYSSPITIKVLPSSNPKKK